MTMTTRINADAYTADLALPLHQLTRARTWTGTVKWFTPPDILEAAYEVLGAIDLDPASSGPASAIPGQGRKLFYSRE